MAQRLGFVMPRTEAKTAAQDSEIRARKFDEESHVLMDMTLRIGQQMMGIL